ncbi:MAG: hypothetical protein Q4E47_00155 [Candidatus Saccharibacteria bacterium]|nr:hypothetical protein [Candidatus Saccharibacteria bacterium]
MIASKKGDSLRRSRGVSVNSVSRNRAALSNRSSSVAKARKKSPYRVKKTVNHSGKMSTNGQKNSGWWVLVGFIVVLTACVVAAIWASIELTDQKIAERKFDELAKKYYAEVLYPAATEVNSNVSAETALNAFSERGLTQVRLRQLINFYNDKKDRAVFSTERLECDTNNSFIVFYPKAPWGKGDYTTQKSLYCVDK